MNAYELADELDGRLDHKAANMLRQQADRIAELEKFVGDLKNITDAQGQKGCWDVDNYMTGLFNGLEMALSIFEQREPQFKDTTPQTKALSDLKQGLVKQGFTFTKDGKFIPPKNYVAQTQTKPLSEKELYEVFDKCYPNNGDGDVVTLVDFARAIEKRHGIK